MSGLVDVLAVKLRVQARRNWHGARYWVARLPGARLNTTGHTPHQAVALYQRLRGLYPCLYEPIPFDPVCQQQWECTCVKDGRTALARITPTQDTP